ncbi:YqzL family protein [Kroppenstedtia pulmonis]|uniref:YqzL family protein n=1 Tax=Kroppenstedtia pulmonis TaxID=1380685 RepID=A0A7D4BHZ3_9BACL|nr:YqzL family protein [Kroppenstedtia pulmonis]QKG84935.1 YqzL family protein [Kroppenstedtia pulmonis]
MRSFSWNCFTVTGSVDAYLLFKVAEAVMDQPERRLPKKQKKREKLKEKS